MELGQKEREAVGLLLPVLCLSTCWGQAQGSLSTQTLSTQTLPTVDGQGLELSPSFQNFPLCNRNWKSEFLHEIS